MSKQLKTKEFYVYTLSDSRNCLTFYIGKGTGSRLNAHKRIAIKNPPRAKYRVYHKIRKILAEGGDILATKIFSSTSQEEAYAFEMETIKAIGRENLTNLTDGGEGGFGHKMTEENKAILLAIAKRPKSPEHRAKIAEAKRGVPRSKESIKKTADAHRGRKRGIDWRNNIANGLRGHKRSEYTKSLLRKPKSESHIAKMRENASKKTLCIETGVIFDSAICAGNSINVTASSIRQAIKNNYCSGGFHWRYL
jgi:hypothetical protein